MPRVERFPADARVEAAGRHGVLYIRLVEAETGGQCVDKRLATLVEGRADDAEEKRLVAHRIGLLRAPREADDTGGDLRLRDEAAGRDVKKQLTRHIPLHEYAKRAVIRGVRRGADAPRDLALDHDGDGVELAAFYERGEHRRRHVIWQIRAHDGTQPGEMPRRKCVDILPEDIAEDKINISTAGKRLCEDALKRLVQLHRRDLARAQGKLLRQAAYAGADLKNAGIFVEPGAVRDITRHP